MLKSITYSPKAVPFFKINEGVGQCNTTSLLVLLGVLINASKCLEVIF
jgi:hypothetical protein